MAWLFGRRKRGWWHAPAGWALAFAVSLPGALLATPVDQYSGAWALPAEYAGLAVALAVTVGFFVVKRHSWLLAAPLSFGLSFSFGLALIEGWSAQIKMAIAVAQVALVAGVITLSIATIVVTSRGLRRVNRARGEFTRDVGDRIVHEGLFREDGERITVYPNRGRLVLRALTTVAALALLVAGGVWALMIAPNVFSRTVIALCLGILLCFGGVATLLTLIRTVMTSPTLVASADGILDNGSMIVTGRGLLRWTETLDVEEVLYSPNRAITYHVLDIHVLNPRDIDRRQPLWKRALANFAGRRQFMGFRIPRPLLDRPPAALVTEIDRYINTHAPKGGWHKAVTDDDGELPDEE